MVARGKELHSLTGDARHVHAVDAREVHLAQRLTVHLRVRHQDALRHQRLVLVLGLPFLLQLRTDEGLNGLSIGLGADDEHLVAKVQDSVAVGNLNAVFMQQAGAHDVAAQKLADLHQRAAGNVLVAHAQHHLVRLLVRVLTLGVGQLLLLVLKADAADVAYGNRSADDAHHAERIGTSVTAGNLRRTVGEHRCQRLVGSTQTGRVRHGTIQRTYHHRQVHRVARIEECKVAGKHHSDVQRNGRRRQQVQRHASLAEALEEARAYLQTDAEHEQNQTEVLRKV